MVGDLQTAANDHWNKINSCLSNQHSYETVIMESGISRQHLFVGRHHCIDIPQSTIISRHYILLVGTGLHLLGDMAVPKSILAQVCTSRETLNTDQQHYCWSAIHIYWSELCITLAEELFDLLLAGRRYLLIGHTNSLVGDIYGLISGMVVGRIYQVR